MTPTQSSQSQSKAQRRAEAQRRAAEKRAAELRRKRTQVGIRVGVVGVVIVAIIVVVVLVTSGSSSPPASFTNPHISLEPIPASMKGSWIQPPAQPAGPEGIGVPSGPKLATLINAATGQTVDGIQCQTGEQTVVHVHTHLTIFVNGQARQVPGAIGIPGVQSQQSPSGPYIAAGTCFYWLHTHAADGIIHIESPVHRTYTLGNFFDEWGQPLSASRVGPASGHVVAIYNGQVFTGNPRDIPLTAHAQIQLEVGTPLVAPEQITFPNGL